MSEQPFQQITEIAEQLGSPGSNQQANPPQPDLTQPQMDFIDKCNVGCVALTCAGFLSILVGGFSLFYGGLYAANHGLNSNDFPITSDIRCNIQNFLTAQGAVFGFGLLLAVGAWALLKWRNNKLKDQGISQDQISDYEKKGRALSQLSEADGFQI